MGSFKLILGFFAITAIVFAMAGGCSPEFNKADADKEVYKIIDSKWKNGFGQKANYIIADSNIPSPNDVNIDITLAETQPEPISLAEAVAIATKYNRDYQTQKENLYLSALSLTGERYKYALKWFGTVDYDYTRNGKEVFESKTKYWPRRTVTKEKWENAETETLEAQIGVQKTFITPEGILLNTNLAFDWLRFLSGDPDTTLVGILSGTLDIPLLGNGGGKLAWENLTQAERVVLYQIRTFNRFRQTFVVSIINEYYGVLRQKDSVNNAKNNWNSSVEYRKQAELEAKCGRTPAYQVDQARQRELDAYNGYVTALQRYEQSLDFFKIQLTIPITTPIELDQNELVALGTTATSEPNFTVDDAIDTALQCRLDLANSYNIIEDAHRKVVLASQGLGVQLDLSASAKVKTERDTDIDNFEFNKGTYNLGIHADLPFDRKNQRNIYREALIILERRQREYSNDIDSVVLDVRQAYRLLLSTAEQYLTQKKSLALAEDRVKNMPVLLKSGRAQIRDLLDAQDSLLEAQNDLTSALVGHTIAILSFYRDIGILQVRPDGMWEQSQTTVSRNQTNERESNNQSSRDNI